MQVTRTFVSNQVEEVAPSLLGVELVRHFSESRSKTYYITEVEAYAGPHDLASHARFGKTARTQAMFAQAGTIYMYLIYGIHWMFNIVTGKLGEPQAVLIRSVTSATGENITGPGRVTKELKLDKSFYGVDIFNSAYISLGNKLDISQQQISNTKRVGVGYAGTWADRKWRWKVDEETVSVE